MKKFMKIAAVLLLCAVLLLAAFAACKIYRQFTWNDYLLSEKLDSLQSSVNSILWQLESRPVDSGHYDFDYSWLDGEEPVLIAHALGGIDGREYTNSLEALELAYENGLRLFEADFQIVDGELLLLHDMERAAEMCGFENENFGCEDFLASKLCGKYTPMAFSDVLEFMGEHPDVYLVTDTKYFIQPQLSLSVAALTAEAMEYDESILERVVVQIYNQRMLDVVMDIYPFKSVIYTLYVSPDDNERVAAFCAKSGIKAVTMPVLRCSEEFVDALNAMDISVLTHTVNDAQEACSLIDTGVVGIYTDFLTPGDFNWN